MQALFHPTRLGLVEPPSKVEKEEWVLVYGGAGSVGQFAVQLAHLAGYKVVTTASPKNHELLKSYGADAVFDVRFPPPLVHARFADALASSTGTLTRLARSSS